MTRERPYTPDELAARWGCSAETVRQQIKRGELRGFRVGRMLRIPADAVEELECRNIVSAGSTAASSSPGPKKAAGADSACAPQQLARLMPRPARS
jgi:excisionase family DNA binding protein